MNAIRVFYDYLKVPIITSYWIIRDITLQDSMQMLISLNSSSNEETEKHYSSHFMNNVLNNLDPKQLW